MSPPEAANEDARKGRLVRTPLSSMTKLLLIRHCEATGQEPESPLTPRGRRQAEQLARVLAHEGIEHAAASPYQRAQQTISPLCVQLGLELRSDPRLVEHRLASPPGADWRHWVARAFTDPEARAPGGDAPSDTLNRGLAAVQDAVALPGLGVLVTHGLLLALVLHSIDPRFGFEGWASLRNPDVFRVIRRDHLLQFERVDLA